MIGDDSVQVLFSSFCISRAVISISDACPCAPPIGWCIIIREWRKAKRLPFVPATNNTAPIEAAIPVHIVDTSLLKYIASYRKYPSPAYTRSAGSIQINGYIFTGICRIEIQQLSLNNICRIIVYLRTQKYNTVHHQTRKNIHLRNIQLAFFNNGGRNITAGYISILYLTPTPFIPKCFGSIISKIVCHNRNDLRVTKIFFKQR